MACWLCLLSCWFLVVFAFGFRWCFVCWGCLVCCCICWLTWFDFGVWHWVACCLVFLLVGVDYFGLVRLDVCRWFTCLDWLPVTWFIGLFTFVCWVVCDLCLFFVVIVFVVSLIGGICVCLRVGWCIIWWSKWWLFYDVLVVFCVCCLDLVLILVCLFVLVDW